MSNIANLRIGPCSLNWKGNDMGYTEGGVKLTYTRKMTTLKVDKYGDSPVDEALTAAELDLVFKVAEPVAAVLQPTVPEGANNVGVAGQQVGFAAGEGASMRASAGQLILHPLSLPATNTSEDICIYLAAPTANVELNYESNNQRLFSVTMSALVSEAYTVGRRLGHIGPLNIS